MLWLIVLQKTEWFSVLRYVAQKYQTISFFEYLHSLLNICQVALLEINLKSDSGYSSKQIHCSKLFSFNRTRIYIYVYTYNIHMYICMYSYSSIYLSIYIYIYIYILYIYTYRKGSYISLLRTIFFRLFS